MSPTFWIFRGLPEGLAFVLLTSECGWAQDTLDFSGPVRTKKVACCDSRSPVAQHTMTNTAWCLSHGKRGMEYASNSMAFQGAA